LTKKFATCECADFERGGQGSATSTRRCWIPLAHRWRTLSPFERQCRR